MSTGVGVPVDVQAFDRALRLDGRVWTGVADREIVGNIYTLASRYSNVQAAGLGRADENGGVLGV